MFPRAVNSSAKVCAKGFLPSRLEAGDCFLGLPSLCFHESSVLPFALTPLAVPLCVVFTTGAEFQHLKARRHRELLLPTCGNVDGALDTSQQSLDLPAPHCWHTMDLVSLLQCWCSMHLMSLLLELFECMFCYNFLNVSALLSVTLQESCKHPQPLPS